MTRGGPGEGCAAPPRPPPRELTAFSCVCTCASNGGGTMPIAVALIILALGYWFAGRGERRRRRKSNQDEINATLSTGLPSTQTALGRRAREVAEAQAAKLVAPPPVHGTARWGRAEDAPGLVSGNRLRGLTGSRTLRLGNLMDDGNQDTDLALEASYPGHILTVAATGTPTPTLQWQLSTDGGTTWEENWHMDFTREARK